MNAKRIEAIYPVSPFQEALLAQIVEAQTDYQARGLLTCTLQGHLDIERLVKSWNRIASQEPLLRTSFVWKIVAKPVQVVHRESTLTIEQLDWRQIPFHQQEKLLKDYLDSELRRPINPSEAGAVRLYLCHVANDTYRFICSYSRLLLDERSARVLLSELFVFYDRPDGGESPQLERNPSYRDYITQLGMQDPSKVETFWKTTLGGFSSATSLVGTLPRSTHTSAEEEYGKQQIRLSSSIIAGLRPMMAEHNVTLTALLEGSWALLLSRYSGEQRVVFGVTVTARSAGPDASETLLGPLTNTLPVLVNVCDERVTASWLGELQMQQTNLRQHGESSLAQIRDWIGQPKNSPLFESRLILDSDPVDVFLGHAFENLNISDIQSFSQKEQPLSIEWLPVPDPTVQITYHRHSFGDATIERMLHQVETLLGEISANPQAKIGELSLLSQAERREILAEWDETARAYPRDRSIHELFEEQVQQQPQRVAVVYEGHELSYQELNRRANQLAHYLRGLGVGPEVPVGICVERSVEMIVGLLGILKAGGAYLPLDPDYPTERIAFMLADTQSQVLLTQERRLGYLPEFDGEVVCLDRDWPLIMRQNEENLQIKGSTENLAYVIYTSGSTGRPKGVLISHYNVARLFAATAEQFEFSEDDVWTLFHSYSFDFSVWELWGALLYGGRVVVVPYLVSRSPETFYQLLCQEEVTILNQTPSAFRSLMSIATGPDADSELRLRAVIFGGEALELSSLSPWFERYGETPQMVNMYGITETTVHVTYCPIDQGKLKQGSLIGTGLKDLKVYVLDRRLEPVPVGMAGELYVGGEGVARGYLKRADLTAERIVPDLWSRDPGRRMYRSGDTGRWTGERELEYLGRADQQVKIRGYRIELGEVESALRDHPDVREAVAVTETGPEGNRRLIGYAVPKRWAIAFMEGEPGYRLPNGLTIVHQNKNETDFLYREIFESQVYLRHGIGLPDDACVVDVGANIGLFTLFVSELCPQARIYAFEPIIPVFEKLRANSLLCTSNVKLFPIGLADRERTAQFTYYPRYSMMSGRSEYADSSAELETVKRFLHNQGSDSARQLLEQADELFSERFQGQTVSSQLRRLTDVMREEKIKRIDLLKIDVERSEMDVVRGLEADDWEKIQQIVVEVHDQVGDQSSGRVQEMVTLLESRGYEVVIEEESQLKGTGIYSLYARRRGTPQYTAAGTPPKEKTRDSVLTTDKLRQWLQAKLPPYMVPNVFVLLERLPLTANGKLDRKALPSVNDAGRQLEQEYVGARTSVEEILVGIFREVLKLDQVGIHDNFFELGGDSILSLQIIAKANEAGLGLIPKQLFQHQNIAELAAVARTDVMIEAEQGSVVGEVPLTPIQEWFFESDDEEPEHFNHAVMLEASEELNIEAFSEVIKQLVKQHDALRHRFQRAENKWRQVCEEFDGTVGLERVDLSEIDEGSESGVIEEVAADYQKRMNLGEGPLMRVVVFEGNGHQQRVMFAAHHLVIDGVSWRILLGDIERGYEQARRGEEIKLGVKTTSYKHWAERLKEEAQSERTRERASSWLAGNGESVKWLPKDKEGANTLASVKSVVVSLTEEETTGLLQEVPRAYKTQIQEVLLVAVARSVSEWSGEQTVLVEVEGHGREEILKGVDLTRTVGWFTTIYPVKVEVRGRNSLELLRNTKERIREAGKQGIYFGMLKYLSEDPNLREKLRVSSRAEISFNYLGQLDLVLREDSLFRGAKESPGETQSQKGKRRYLIDINGHVIGGRLHLVWTYSENVHRRETIETVAERTKETLREVITGSRSTSERPYTPSDFPLAGLDQRLLDRLIGANNDIEDIYALSPLQKAMLFHNISGSSSQALFVQVTCQISGKFDITAFKKAWQRLAEHHPILRTSFEWEELEDPVQIVHRRVEMPIDYLDWGAITKQEQESRFEVLIQADRWRGIDISHPPLMRLSLIRLGDDLYRLIWSHHHIVSDGWSVQLILQEVFAGYEAYQRGKEPVRQERTPYREYLAWLKRQDPEKAEAYWRERLRGFDQPTKLWIDRGRGRLTNREEIYEDQQVKIGKDATEELRSVARRHHLTINTILQGAWGLLLSKYSGEEDVIFGATVSGRPVDLPGSHSIIGPFINTLPVRINIPHRSSLLAWLTEIQREQVEDSQYAYSSLVEQYSEIPLGIRLYESILIFENYPTGQSSSSSSSQNREQHLEFSDVRAPVRTKYPLTIVSVPGTKLALSIAYDLSRFDAPDISRLLAHFQNLIEEIANNPERPLWALSPMPRTERDQILTGWKGRQRIDADDWYIHQMVELHAEKTPDAIAVVIGQEQVSYRQLNERADQLAAFLQTRGVGPEVGVGIYLEPSSALLVGLLGVMKAGGACISLEPADFSDHVGSILLTQQSLIEDGLEIKAEIIRLDSDWNMVDGRSRANLDTGVRQDNLAFVIHTSGSTGEPKRVMITHRGLRNHLLGRQEAVGLTEEDRVLTGHRSYLDTATLELFWPLMSGARLVIARPEAYLNRGWLLELIAAQKITTAALTPSILSLLLRKGVSENCDSLKQIVLSGERLYHLPLPQEHSFARLNVGLYNLYSVTETSGAMTAQICKPLLDAEILSVGQPMANTQIYLFDSHLQVAPAGVAGEVWVSGESLARGYCDQPDFTAERFIPHPFSENPGERVFRSGDVARSLPDGKIEMLARSEHQINIQCSRTEPAVIERALMEYSGIDQAVLLLVGDAVGGPRLTAYLACNADSASSAEELRRFLRERFPVQMIPSAFLMMKTLPLTINGRIDRKALAAMKLNAADSGLAVAGKGTPYEEMLSDIWAGLFGIDEVGREDNFFEMGGHSLLATQLMSRVREAFKVEISLKDLFEEPTINGLARKIEEAMRAREKEQAPPLVRVSRESRRGMRFPLSFAQQRLWFLDQLVPDNPFYNVPGGVRLEGRLDFEVLERVINEIVRRHEVLRTRIEVEGGEPVQVIDEWEPRRLEVEDLTSLSEEERGEEVKRITRGEAETRFDLSRGPLLKIKVLKLEEEQQVVLFTMHHIVCDVWSIGILSQEVEALYQAYSAGEPSPLPELEIQYADYAVWQRNWLQGEVLKQQLNYWSGQLARFEPLELPTDYPRPALATYRGASLSLNLSNELTQELRAFSRREGVTLFMTLLATFQILLSRYSRQERVVVGSPIANRNRAEIEGLIGFFVNMLVLRADVGGNPTFSALLGQVKEAALGAYAHQDFPFERLVEELQPERALSHNPLFQVTFALQTTPHQQPMLLARTEARGESPGQPVYRETTTRFDLELFFWEHPGGLIGKIFYSRDLFEPETIRRMVGHFENLLAGVIGDSDRPISALPMLSQAEHQQMLEEWNQHRVESPREATLVSLFEEQVRRMPEATAVCYQDEYLSYRELNARANQLACYLQKRGMTAERLVGICMERSLELIIGVFGILKAGGAYVPLDPTSPFQYLNSMLKSSRLTLLLTQQWLAARVPAGQVDLLCVDAEWPIISNERQENPAAEATPESLAYVLHSSGKGIMVEHRGIQHRLDWLQAELGLGPSDAVLHRSSLVADRSVWEIFWPLLSGSRLVIGEPNATRELDCTWRTVAEQEISIAHFLPSELAAMEWSGESDSVKRTSKLRAVLCSGELLHRRSAENFLRSFSGDLYYLMGYPEAATDITLCDCRSGRLKEGPALYENTSWPVYLLDQHLQPVPFGVPGDIYIAGDGIARGYLNDGWETERNFRNNPLRELPGEKMFRTGDVGIRLEDGCIKMMTRGDGRCWLKGFRLGLDDIQAALLIEPSVEDVALAVRMTDTGRQEMIAYVVSNSPFSPDRLRAHLETLLPQFMIPDAYVAVSNIPLTAGGKVDERALSRLAVIDTDLVSRYERRFRSEAQSEKIALIIRDQQEQIAPMHLSDLLPDWRRASMLDHQEPGAKPQLRTDLKNEEIQKSLAISHGEPLRLPADHPATLPDALGRSAQTAGKGIVYVQPDGSERFQSYSALLREAERILTGLRKLGARPQDKVIFQFDRNEDFIAAFWGCQLAGVVPVPINVAPSYERASSTTNKLHNAWQMLDKPLVLSSARLAPEIGSSFSSLHLDDFRVETIDELREFDPSADWYPSHPDDMAIMLLTSGSTGLPKGVVQSHRAILIRSAGTAQLNGFSADDVSLNWFPLDHVGGIMMFHLRDTFLGCHQIQAPTPLILEQPLRWLDLIHRHRATITWAPNFAYGLINARAEEIEEGRWDLSSMRFILNGGEAIVPRTARLFMSLLAPCGLPATAMHPAWGMSETSSAATYSDRFSLDSTSDEDPFVEVGLPIPGLSLRIVDECDRTVEECTVGRLQVKGQTVTTGYYRNPELNREAFTEDGWFNTGDLGFLRQERLTISGRQKDVIIINGVNYYSHEIEAVVEEIPGIETSFTAACATREPGSDTDRLIVFFSPAVSDDQALIGILKEIREKMVRDIGVNPAHLIPVEKSVIPKTDIGKIQRAQLRRRFEAGEFEPLLRKVDILRGNEHTLPAWFYTKVWRPREVSVPCASPLTGQYLIFLDRAGLGERFCLKLDRFNFTYVTVEPATEFKRSGITHYEIKPDDPEHYRRLIQSLADDGIQIDRILHLWTYSDQVPSVMTREQLEQAQIPGTYSLVFLAQALAGGQLNGSPLQLYVISRSSQAVLASDELAFANAPVLGLIKTMASEMPWLRCRHVDLSYGALETMVDHIIQETQAATKDQEVAYRNGRRLIARLQAAAWHPDRAQPLPFKPGGFYLLSGGLGGLGVQIARHLLENYRVKLLLVGRTVLPARSEWDDHLRARDEFGDKIRALQSLEEIGGEVVYEAADVTDLERLRQLTEQSRARWQCDLDGVIHLAGTFHERLIRDETRENLSAVLNAKLVGAWTLDQLVKGTTAELFITFSSVNGFFGGAGVGAYAAANSFLDCFSAVQNKNARFRSYCFAWSMWDEIGMSRGYQKKDATRARGYQVLPLDKGLWSLLIALRHDRRSLLIGLDGGNPHIRPHVEAPSRQAQALSVFFPADLDRPAVDQLKQLMVEDRFQSPVNCDLIEVTELPLSADGEIDQEHLTNLLSLSPGSSTGRIAPRTDTERQVAGIWQTVLGLSTPGINDNFFEIGGHSLLAMQVVSRATNTFGVEIAVRDLFEEPTIEGFARKIEETMRAREKEQAPPLVRVSRESRRGMRFPLSFAQQRLWFLDQLVPDNPFYNVPGGVRLEGRLDFEVLERVINEIVRRHEVLRTRIEVEGGEPVQVIDEWEPRRLEVEDLTSLSEEERGEEVKRITRGEAETRFDLSRGPLLKIKVLKLEEEQQVVLFTMHHIVCDAWSMRVLVREVLMHYEAMSEGKKSPLPELEIQYADYAVWQRAYLAGGVLEREVGYWKEQLKDAATLELPTDRARPVVPSYRGGDEKIELGKDVREGLRKLSQREGMTLFMVLMAAFKVVLMRHSGEEDVSVGTAIANRNRREVEGLIGFFVNTLVMRTDLSGNPSFWELMKREREVALGAYAHQEVPFEKLVEEINPERDLSRSPLFQVMMTLHNARREESDPEAKKVKGIEGEIRVVQFDLTLVLTDYGDGIAGGLEYSRDLYDGETIRRVIRHYERVLETVVRDAGQRIGEIELMSESEREQVVVKWNETAQAYPRDRTIHELFEEQVEQRPEAVAVVYEEQEMSYQELNRRANRLAHYLRGLGVGPEVLVGICVERSVEMVVGLLGILKAGGAYLPLDPSYPAERLRSMLEDGEPLAVMTQERFLGVLPEFSGEIICLDQDWLLAEGQSEENSPIHVGGENLAYVIYTSGSTGRPKGICITHRAINRLVVNTDYVSLDSSSKVGQAANYSFDAATFEIWGPLLAGGTVIGIKKEDALSVVELGRQLQALQINTLFVTTALFNELARLVPESLSNLETLLFGGEAVEPKWVEEVLENGSPERLLHVYGPTESTTFATWQEVDRVEKEARSVPIGRPIANTEAYLLDGRFEPVPAGVTGEIYLGGDGLARGYLGRREQTAERFVPHPFRESGMRLYRTGDLGRRDADGSIEFLGRMDWQVKVRGHRIELQEIEAVLSEHRSVRQCIVVASEDEGRGKRLLAYVVGETEVTAPSLKRYVRERLPEYMVPEAILVLEEMPLTANGKIDRGKLPGGLHLGRQVEEEYVEARTPIEELAVGIYEEVLRLDRVGIRDNFFEIGGHSLLAMQVISRVRDTFRVEIEVRSIFEEPTVEGLAVRIDAAMRAGEQVERPPLVRVERGEGLPLSFAQQRLWFIDHLEPGSAVYNIPGALRLEGRLDLEALGRTINEIARRHEVLRTRFVLEEGEPVQVIDEWRAMNLAVTDLTGLTWEERAVEVSQIAREESGTAFDLSRGPLLRVKVLKLEEADHILLYTMHHIASDAWSMGVLVREMGTLYRAISEGKESPLPELAVQYADYAYWQRQYLRGEVLEEHLLYWKKQLSGKLPVVGLTSDHPRPAVPTNRGVSKSIQLPVELCESLKALSKREGVTTFMLLLAAFKTMLYRYTGQDDIIIGAPALNRNRAEIEPLIGFFVNMLPMRTDLSGNPRFSELLMRVKDVALGAYKHQELPFEKVVEAIQPEREVGRMPLFNIAFGVQNAPQEDLRLPGLKTSSLGGRDGFARFDLSTWVTEVAETMRVDWLYSTDLFEEATIVRVHGHFETLLASIVARPDTLIDELEMFSEAERAQQTTNRITREEYNYTRFKSMKPTAVTLSEE
jgi:amino acid adenylation domain-containing protein/non-ribosomal peptide synthase protein (TIGR01720 family)/FkbM family methyltransferase